ncbi:MAG: hypothetical protein KJZ90_00060 [Rhodocyclaceae bacterium]|nr:hypothetical protein [Rhodocyclaceae bacterium]
MTMKIICCTCAKQALNQQVPVDDPYVTTLIGARAGFKPGECYCGHCAKEMDENGLFPEEKAQVEVGLL